MNALVTNRGAYLLLGTLLFNDPDNSTFYIALIDQGSAAPTVDTNLMSDLTEIAAGNGYTAGGASCARVLGNGASLTEDDASDYAEARLRNITACQASGGAIPSDAGSGGLIRYMVLTTDEGTVANRQIIGVYDLDASLETGFTVPDGKELNVTGHKIKLSN